MSAWYLRRRRIPTRFAPMRDGGLQAAPCIGLLAARSGRVNLVTTSVVDEGVRWVQIVAGVIARRKSESISSNDIGVGQPAQYNPIVDLQLKWLKRLITLAAAVALFASSLLSPIVMFPLAAWKPELLDRLTTYIAVLISYCSALLFVVVIAAIIWKVAF